MADKGEMDKAAESKDYDTALKKAKDLEPKLTEYEKQQALIATLKMETECVSTKPADRKRTKIGVGEEVKLTITPATLSPINWNVTGNGKLSANTGSTVTFTANDSASKPKITADYAGTKVDVEFEVFAPTAPTVTKDSELGGYPAGQAGTGMTCQFQYNPTDVSFYRVQILEVPGPATSITGYFTSFSAAALAHHPSPTWVTLGADNKLAGAVRDTAAIASPLPNGTGGFPAWSDGGFDWVIPNKYRVIGASATGGYPVGNVTQTFRIKASGVTTVTKQGTGTAASVSRTP